MTIKEAMFCFNTILEMGLNERFVSVSLYIDNMSALHVAGNYTYSHRAKHIELRYFFMQELVEEGKIIIHYATTEDQLAGLGTK